MKWKFPAPVLLAAAALSLLPVGCGSSAPTAAEKPKYPPGQDPDVDFLPNMPPPKKAAH